MASVNKLVGKVSKALKAKGMMPLIDQEQFYGDNGSVTKYVLHYGRARGKNNDVVAIAYGKVNLLKSLIEILKAGDSSE